MKTAQVFFVMTALMVTACSQSVSQSGYRADQPVSVEIFYAELSPFGRWMEYPPYGYVWLPDVPPEFAPYLTQGHWVYTGYGWTWYSYYAWGWAPFHYGRWRYDIVYGWMWLPDTVWGPAWVVWRRGGGYCGWAPLDFGLTVHLVIGGHPIPHGHWIFVHDHDLPRTHVHRYRVDHARNSDLIGSATLSRHVREERDAHYMPGPERSEIEQASRRRINEHQIAERPEPGSDRLIRDRLEIYKPEVRREREGEHRPAPATVYKPEEIQKTEVRKTRTRAEDPRRRTQPAPRPEVERQPDVRRQPAEGQRQPERRPARSTVIKKKNPTGDEQPKRSDRNRRSQR